MHQQIILDSFSLHLYDVLCVLMTGYSLLQLSYSGKRMLVPSCRLRVGMKTARSIGSFSRSFAISSRSHVGPASLRRWLAPNPTAVQRAWEKGWAGCRRARRRVWRSDAGLCATLARSSSCPLPPRNISRNKAGERVFADGGGHIPQPTVSSVYLCSPQKTQCRFELGKLWRFRAVFEPGPCQLYALPTGTPCFYPVVRIAFEIQEEESHYHVPLLISPFGYSTYRGS